MVEALNYTYRGGVEMKYILLTTVMLSILLAVGCSDDDGGGAVPNASIVAGLVVEAPDFEPVVKGTVQDIWVTIEELNIGSLTDTNGTFVIDNVPPGAFTMAFMVNEVVTTTTFNVPDDSTVKMKGIRIGEASVSIGSISVSESGQTAEELREGLVIEQVEIDLLVAEEAHE
jgi:iron complex outermembrane receptor protein